MSGLSRIACIKISSCSILYTNQLLIPQLLFPTFCVLMIEMKLSGVFVSGVALLPFVDEGRLHRILQDYYPNLTDAESKQKKYLFFVIISSCVLRMDFVDFSHDLKHL